MIEAEINFLKKQKEAKNIYSFYFTKENFYWRSGQHAIFRFKENIDDSKDYRVFTISSSENENQIMFSTIIKEKPSVFKQRLMKLKPKDKIQVKGPYGDFCLQEKTNIIGIAGGIGITPFRALVYDLSKDFAFKETKLFLLYIAKNNNHAFKKELGLFQKSNPNIKINYMSERELLYKMLKEKIKISPKDAKYYISGKTDMINSIKGFIIQNNISEENIKTDPFEGY